MDVVEMYYQAWKEAGEDKDKATHIFAEKLLKALQEMPVEELDYYIVDVHKSEVCRNLHIVLEI